MPKIIEGEDIVLEIPMVASEELAHELLAEVKDTLELLKPWLPWAKDSYSLKDEMSLISRNVSVV